MLGDGNLLAAGTSQLQGLVKILCADLQPWHVLVSARKPSLRLGEDEDQQLTRRDCLSTVTMENTICLLDLAGYLLCFDECQSTRIMTV